MFLYVLIKKRKVKIQKKERIFDGEKHQKRQEGIGTKANVLGLETLLPLIWVEG